MLHSMTSSEQEEDKPKRKMNPNSMKNLKNAGKRM